MHLKLTQCFSRAQNIRTISIYTEADAASAHVALADEAILLKGVESKAYIDR
jgi:urea carboxylase